MHFYSSRKKQTFFFVVIEFFCLAKRRRKTIYHVFPTSGVDFINVFTRSFYARRSPKRKKVFELTVFFALLGSARVKAARKMLAKLTPDVYLLKKNRAFFCLISPKCWNSIFSRINTSIYAEYFISILFSCKIYLDNFW